MRPTIGLMDETSTIKPGTKLLRSFAVNRAAIDQAARTVELAFASEQPYERWWGIEILDCSTKSMRMQRLKSGAPLLCDHNTRDQIGVIETVQNGADKVARSVVRAAATRKCSLLPEARGALWQVSLPNWTPRGRKALRVFRCWEASQPPTWPAR